MNTFGKILAVCNFLIAIAVVAFVGLVFATRTNWKNYADDREKENIVIKSAREQDAQTNNKLNLEITAIRAAKDKSDNEIKSLKEDKEAELKAKDLQIAELNRTITERDVKKGVDLAEIERLKEEVTGLLATLNKRQLEIVKLQESVKEEQTKAIQNKNEAATFISRNANLLAEINRLNVLLQEMQNKIAGGGTLPNPLRDPNAANPPSVAVKGRIDEVSSKDKTLVKVSVGTDHGVKNNHTLEVYRKEPRSEYLGMIRILDSYPHYAIGKIMPSSTAHSTLQPGDIVADRIGP